MRGRGKGTGGYPAFGACFVFGPLGLAQLHRNFKTLRLPLFATRSPLVFQSLGDRIAGDRGVSPLFVAGSMMGGTERGGVILTLRSANLVSDRGANVFAFVVPSSDCASVLATANFANSMILVESWLLNRDIRPFGLLEPQHPPRTSTAALQWSAQNRGVRDENAWLCNQALETTHIRQRSNPWQPRKTASRMSAGCSSGLVSPKLEGWIVLFRRSRSCDSWAVTKRT